MSDETRAMFNNGNVTVDDAFTFADANGNTALHLAAYCGQIDTVKLLLLLNPKPPIVLNNDGETAITLGENQEPRSGEKNQKSWRRLIPTVC